MPKQASEFLAGLQIIQMGAVCWAPKEIERIWEVLNVAWAFNQQNMGFYVINAIPLHHFQARSLLFRPRWPPELQIGEQKQH